MEKRTFLENISYVLLIQLYKNSGNKMTRYLFNIFIKLLTKGLIYLLYNSFRIFFILTQFQFYY